MFKLFVRWTILLALVGGGLGSVTAGAAGFRSFYARGCRWNQCGIPYYGYGHDAVVASASLVAVAPADQPGPRNELDTADGNNRDRKVFPTPVNSLVANGVTLNRIGLALYDGGAIACTGMLSYSGGAQEALLGANVIVRVRAYSYAPRDESGLENARLVWETAKPLWVSRNSTRAISLMPTSLNALGRTPLPVAVHDGLAMSNPLNLIADRQVLVEEITHLEIVLEHYEDN